MASRCEGVGDTGQKAPVKILDFCFSPFDSEEAKVQLSWASPNPESSDPSHLHQAAQAPPQRNQRLTGGEVSATCALVPMIGRLALSLKAGDETAKAAGAWKGLRVTVKLTIQDSQVPSASVLIIRALKEPPRVRRQRENSKHSGNITSDELLTLPDKRGKRVTREGASVQD